MERYTKSRSRQSTEGRSSKTGSQREYRRQRTEGGNRVDSPEGHCYVQYIGNKLSFPHFIVTYAGINILKYKLITDATDEEVKGELLIRANLLVKNKEMEGACSLLANEIKEEEKKFTKEAAAGMQRTIESAKEDLQANSLDELVNFLLNFGQSEAVEEVIKQAEEYRKQETNMREGYKKKMLLETRLPNDENLLQ